MYTFSKVKQKQKVGWKTDECEKLTVWERAFVFNSPDDLILYTRTAPCVMHCENRIGDDVYRNTHKSQEEQNEP